jgi:hypothetical protein
MDICSKDHELDHAFSKAFGGSPNETLFQTFRRAIHDLSNTVINPKALTYEIDDLECRLREIQTKYSVAEVTIMSHAHCNPLNCAVWQHPAISSPKPCFIYIHSDSRCLVDAADILPIAERHDANLVGYDIPGTGKSVGAFDLRPSIQAEFLHAIVQWVMGNLSPTAIILWSRGLSTAFAVEYLRTRQSLITAAVFDSPFASTRGIIDAGIHTFRQQNFSYVPGIIFRPLVWAVRQDLKKSIGVDPFQIRPYEVASMIRIPCICLSALQDDVIPHEQGKLFSDKLSGPRSYITIQGGHIGSRSRETILLVDESLRRYLHIDPPAVAVFEPAREVS